jgi:hypothetical protein
MDNKQYQNILLIVSGIGLIPIALSYGIVPDHTLTPLFGFSVTNISLTHILRAVMGLYLGQIAIWFLGAFNPNLRRPAMYCLIVFMLGLAAGRLFSFIIDGISHWLLIVYFLLEVLFGFTGIVLLKKGNKLE